MIVSLALTAFLSTTFALPTAVVDLDWSPEALEAFETTHPLRIAISPQELEGLPPVELQRRQRQICSVDVCTRLFYSCVKTCDSLENGECFQAQTSPTCEACVVTIDGPGCEAQ